MASASWLVNIFQTFAAIWVAFKAFVVKHFQAGRQLQETNCDDSAVVTESPTNDSGKLSKRQKKNQKKSVKAEISPDEMYCEEYIRQSPSKRFTRNFFNKVAVKDEIMYEAVDNDLQTVDAKVDDHRLDQEGDEVASAIKSEVVVVSDDMIIPEEIEAVKTESADPAVINHSIPSDRQSLLKESMKLSKKLREITALEQQMIHSGAKLDKLQAAKIQKKSSLEQQLALVNSVLAKMSDSGIDSDASTQVDDSTGSDTNDDKEAMDYYKDVVHVYALDESGQPVLKFLSVSPKDSPISVWQEVEKEEHETPKVEAPRSPPVTPQQTWVPKLRHQIQKEAVEEPKKMPQKVSVPKEIHNDIKEVGGVQVLSQRMSLLENPLLQQTRAEVAVPELPTPAELEALGTPPGLLPPGLAPTNNFATNLRSITETSEGDIPIPPGLKATVDPGPPPGLGETLLAPPPGLEPLAVQSSQDVIEGTVIEGTEGVQALLQSISLELNRRVTHNLTSDFSNKSPHLSRTSSDSDFSTRASSGDGSKSPLTMEMASAPPLSFAYEADPAAWNSNVMWDPLNMPSDFSGADFSGVDFAQYSMMDEYSMYAASALCNDPFLSDCHYTKSCAEDYSHMFNSSVMM